ncbi:MAG TPA: ComF family protein [Verrucomicrobiales bacterium]|nr:ComF family protein [Verrucomicrobiales bacterium]
MNWRLSAKQWTRALLDLVYPLRCPACTATLPEGAEPGAFCAACEQELQPIEPPFCERCAEPFQGEFSGLFTCPNCSGRKVAFEFAVCLWLSRGPVREVVHRLKYGRIASMRLPLARLMLPALNDARLAGGDWLMVPVPLHSRKLRERRFNQSAEIARTLHRLSGTPFHEALRRTRYTSSQAALDRDERLQNLRGAFTVYRRAVPRITGRRILLIDDVFTTGATAHECAATLRKHGAAEVVVLTAARG